MADVTAAEVIAVMDALNVHRWRSMGVDTVLCECGRSSACRGVLDKHNRTCTECWVWARPVTGFGWPQGYPQPCTPEEATEWEAVP